MDTDRKFKISPGLKESLSMLAKDDISETIKITEDNVKKIHGELTRIFGGANGILNADLLDNVCSSIYQSFGGEDLFPTVFDKAAKLLYDFAHYQIFEDGNKRIAFTSCFALLRWNGFVTVMGEQELADLVMDIANSRITEEDTARIIREKTEFISDKETDIRFLAGTEELEEEKDKIAREIMKNHAWVLKELAKGPDDE